MGTTNVDEIVDGQQRRRIRVVSLVRRFLDTLQTMVTVPPDDRDGLERLARYLLLRPPVSLDRLQVDEHAQAVAYAARVRPGYEPHGASALLDPRDFLARVVMHIPDPRRHVIRYYGAYSSVVRARCAREMRARTGTGQAHAGEKHASEVAADPDLRALRRSWAQLIRRIYEADPLVCPRCGATMRIVAFLTEPRVIQKILRYLAAKGADQRSPPQSSTAA